MSYQLSADELSRRWGNRSDGHPTFTRALHAACLADGRTAERDYWLWVSDHSGYERWTRERGWL